MAERYGLQHGQSIMNVFVLNTGRCGSTTFTKACQHITNYTSAHESRSSFLGDARFAYSDNHIESDNRLSWLLGRLDKEFGDDAFYVHLKRERTATARSFAKRYAFGIINAYRRAILDMGRRHDASPMAISLDYWDTVNSNIELFLKDKSKKMEFGLETARQDFEKFWQEIEAQGDLNAALAEFDIPWNATREKKRPIIVRIRRRLGQMIMP